jgi:hypothetical protein
VGGEGGCPHGRHPGQAGQDLAGRGRQELAELRLNGGDVSLQALVAGQVAAQPLGAELGVVRWGSSRRQRSTQNRAVARVTRPVARACNDRIVGGLPAKVAAQASTA